VELLFSSAGVQKIAELQLLSERLGMLAQAYYLSLCIIGIRVSLLNLGDAESADP
jgi:hypothetical protein